MYYTVIQIDQPDWFNIILFENRRLHCSVSQWRRVVEWYELILIYYIHRLHRNILSTRLMLYRSSSITYLARFPTRQFASIHNTLCTKIWMCGVGYLYSIQMKQSVERKSSTNTSREVTRRWFMQISRYLANKDKC